MNILQIFGVVTLVSAAVLTAVWVLIIVLENKAKKGRKE